MIGVFPKKYINLLKLFKSLNLAKQTVDVIIQSSVNLAIFLGKKIS